MYRTCRFKGSVGFLGKEIVVAVVVCLLFLFFASLTLNKFLAKSRFIDYVCVL